MKLLKQIIRATATTVGFIAGLAQIAWQLSKDKTDEDSDLPGDNGGGSGFDHTELGDSAGGGDERLGSDCVDPGALEQRILGIDLGEDEGGVVSVVRVVDGRSEVLSVERTERSSAVECSELTITAAPETEAPATEPPEAIHLTPEPSVVVFFEAPNSDPRAEEYSPGAIEFMHQRKALAKQQRHFYAFSKMMRKFQGLDGVMEEGCVEAVAEFWKKRGFLGEYLLVHGGRAIIVRSLRCVEDIS